MKLAEITYETMSRAIWTGYLPTLVPPNFCTSQPAAGSAEFWCRFGGVCTPSEQERDDVEEA
jgi:hypothetical protein